jgi:hypothetical protein
MKIKMRDRKCYTVTQKRAFMRLAKHVTSHYPKDSTLHKAVRSCFQSFDEAAGKLSKAKPKTARRKVRRAPKRVKRARRVRKPAKRRTGMKRKGMKRARRPAPRRPARRGRRPVRRVVRRRRAA